MPSCWQYPWTSFTPPTPSCAHRTTFPKKCVVRSVTSSNTTKISRRANGSRCRVGKALSRPPKRSWTAQRVTLQEPEYADRVSGSTSYTDSGSRHGRRLSSTAHLLRCAQLRPARQGNGLYRAGRSLLLLQAG